MRNSRTKIFAAPALAAFLCAGLVACQQHKSPDDPSAAELVPENPDLSGTGHLKVFSALEIVPVDRDCPEAAIFFPTESAELDEQDSAVLDQIAGCLKGTEEVEEINVTGNTDPRGTEEYNQELAEERARAVAEYLQNQGVADNSFEIYARGEEGMTEGEPQLWPLQRSAIVGTEDPGS